MKMPADTNLTSNADYRRFIEELKSRVLSARISAARAITHEAILLYWDIGRGIVEKQQTLGWGESVVELVAKDLQEAFPGTTGFSSFNLWRMRQLYLEYTSPEFLAQVAPEIKRSDSNNPRQAVSGTSEQLVVIDQGQFLAQLVPELLCPIPWGHHIEIIKKNQITCRPYLVLACHSAIRLVAKCPAQSDQGQRLRTGGDREEGPQLSAGHAGIPRRAGG
ncbi:DUF1016 N-terminal domain-containing protein [Propionivibrio sp.]|uniref:DUF1016 N-terminal domain-containing protein n=1 Tax=Propionivibrio sp. TaxID=2212460 RepID=UPI0025EEF9F0|nr:DUF1016 N-terminal domain-containing protein [Propionivibrio sp.]